MRRIGSIGACLAAVLAMGATAATTASASSYGVMAWGANGYGQLGDDGTSQQPAPVTLGHPNDVTAVSAGEYFSLALLGNETVEAWGENFWGQLGIGTSSGPKFCDGWPCSPTAVKVHKLTGVTAISAGGSFSLALKEGHVWAWGIGTSGELGDGGTGWAEEPVEASGLSNVTAIAAGPSFSLALKEGHVWAWGRSADGVLGNGSEEGPEDCGGSHDCATKPVEVPGLSEVEAIAAGGEHGLALKKGHVWAWGSDYYGALGDGGPAAIEGPVEVSGLSEVTAIAAGDGFSLALEKGKVKAWGSNYYGELGDGKSEGPEKCSTEPCATTPVEVSGLSEVAAISAGEAHSLALLEDGKVMAWGEDERGELGYGTESGPEKCAGHPCSTTPVQVKLLVGRVAGISAGANQSLAYGPPGPIVSGVSPGVGSPSGGTEVRITGENFNEVTEVYFGSTSAKHWEVISPDEIIAISPAGTGITHVVVTTSSGTIERSREGEGNVFRYVTTEAPEYGRCVKAKGTGKKYSGAGCTAESAEGSYEWKPGVVKAGFTLTGVSRGEKGSETVELETVGGTKVLCTAQSGSGEYSDVKDLANVVIKFSGCESGVFTSYPCTTPGSAEGEVVTSELDGELGWKDETANAVLALHPSETGVPFAEFECGLTPVVVRGSVLVSLAGKTGKMTEEITLKYEQASGKQEPSKFEQVPEDELVEDVLESQFEHGTFERTGLRLATHMTSDEAVEINATV